MPQTTVSPITPRDIEIDLTAGIPVDAAAVAKELLRGARMAGLSTLDPRSGYPFGTLTNVATEHDGTPVFLAARLALHARNLHHDSRASLSFNEPGASDVLTTARLTLVGRVELIPIEEDAVIRARYLARFPKAKLYSTLPDAQFRRFRIEALQLGAGPGRNGEFLDSDALRTDIAGAAALIAAEPAELEQLNADRALLERCVRAAGGSAGAWRATGIDPDGVDFARGDEGVRLWSPAPLRTPADLHEMLRTADA